ncbi:hypothetical protein CRYUN_Cryun28dG0017100 [Craigia yunnanensis]
MLGMLEDGKVWLSEWFFWVKPWCPELRRLDIARVLTLARKDILIPMSIQILFNRRSFVCNITIEDGPDFLGNPSVKRINKAKTASLNSSSFSDERVNLKDIDHLEEDDEHITHSSRSMCRQEGVAA